MIAQKYRHLFIFVIGTAFGCPATDEASAPPPAAGSKPTAATSKPADATSEPTAAASRPAIAFRTERPMGTMGPSIRLPTQPTDDWTSSDGRRGAQLKSPSRGLSVEVLQGRGYWSTKLADDDDLPKPPNQALVLAVATAGPTVSPVERWQQSVPGKEAPAILHFASFVVDRSGTKTRVVVKSWTFDNDNALVWLEAPETSFGRLEASAALIMGVDALTGLH